MKKCILMGAAALVAGTFLLALGAGTSMEASAQIPKEPIKWSIKANLPEKPLKPGDRFTVELTATIEEHWHLYAMEQAEGGPIPTRISLPEGQPFELAGAIESSEPKTATDPAFNMTTAFYEGQAVFTVPVKISAKAAAGKTEIKISATHQSCNDELCLPPRTVKLAAEINIAR